MERGKNKITKGELKLYMKKIIFSLLFIFSVMSIWAQDPGSNIGKSFYVMKQDFPGLRYVKTTEKGMLYIDGEPQDGISMFFTFYDNKVVEECMIVQADNGFARLWFDKMVDSFISNTSPVCGVHGYNAHHFCYSAFKVHLIYVSEKGTNTAMIVYEEGGCGYFSGMTPKEFSEMYNQK